MANEAEKKKHRSSSLDRHISVYPHPKYYNMVVALANCEEMSKSEVINTALKEYFDRMPESERQRIISVSKNRY